MSSTSIANSEAGRMPALPGFTAKIKNAKIKSKIFSLAFSLVLLWTCTGASRVESGPHLVLIPKISVAEKEFDLGKIEEGVEVKHVFKVSNQGQKNLKILKTTATCGCTVPRMSKDVIEPGQTVDLEVIMDTSMKQGSVSKPIEIYSNDPVTPRVTIHLKAQVRSPHADLRKNGEGAAKIFTGRCAACHVTKGIGKIGEDLFLADCAMCHGFRAKGIPGVAPALVPFDYHQKAFADGMEKIIAHGSKTHRSMPGFLKESGGPLSAKEISSLVEYLKWKSDLDLKK